MINIAKWGILFIMLTSGIANAAGRQSPFVTKTSRNAGDTITPVYISCSSTTWTAVLPANSIRREAQLITITSADIVCLSTNSASAICDATKPGYRLLATIPFEYFSESVLYCRAVDTKAAVAVYGIDYKDSADNTSAP